MQRDGTSMYFSEPVSVSFFRKGKMQVSFIDLPHFRSSKDYNIKSTAHIVRLKRLYRMLCFISVVLNVVCYFVNLCSVFAPVTETIFSNIENNTLRYCEVC